MEQIKIKLIKTEELINNKTYIICKDYTVSKEEYSLIYNAEYDMLITDPIPENIGDYYKSDEYISHTDSSETLIDKVYKKVRNYTLKKKLKLINSFNIETKTLLDIGAGTGDFLKICKDNKWEVYGIEPSENARKISNSKNIILEADIDNFENKKFDIITMWHVLEHITDLDQYLNKLKKLLKSNGKLIVAVPNYKSYDARYYKEYWAAFDVPRHISHFSKNSIHKKFSNIKMSVQETLPMKFDSYYVSLLSEKYKKGKIKPLKAFWIGFLSNMKAKQSKEYSSLIYIIKKD